ncbi:MAG: ABC transporter permease [Rhizobiaceae bacterium]
MEFIVFLLRRVLWSIFVLLGLSIVIFLIARVIPGDPARIALGPSATAEQVLDLRSRLGLDRPMIEQYFLFASGLFEGDLGRSLLTSRPVQDDIRATFAATFELVFVTVSLSLLLGLPLGIVAARWRSRWPDHLVQGVSIFSAVTPTFLKALLLQMLAGYVLHVLPTQGRLSGDIDFAADVTGMMLVDSILRGRGDIFLDAGRHLILPAIALSLASMGQIARITRASMIEVFGKDYIEASRAFGIPERVQVLKYALRPSLVPPLTILGLQFSALIGNSFVVELIFAWPGMASYGMRTILQKDLNAVMGVVMVSGAFFVTVNLLIDIVVGFVDPRIRIRAKG